MSERDSQFQDLVGGKESLRVMESLRRGATRRDVLAMLMAGSMHMTYMCS
jgi:peptide/nickel transport system substrate-binding protein